jgi:PKD repeat protein
MRRLALLFAFLTGSGVASAQPKEIRPDETVPFRNTQSGRVDDRTGFALVVYGTDYRPAPSDPEAMAREFLRERGPEMGIVESEVTLVAIRKTPGGTRVRFEQEVSGLPVYQSDVVISLSREGRVAFVVNGFRPGLRVRPVASKSTAAAVATARDYLGIAGPARLERARTVIYPYGNRARVAHRVELMAPASVSGDWELLVDAESGEVFRAVNRALETKGRPATGNRPAAPATAQGASSPAAPTTIRSDKTGSPRRIDGTGWVFDPDPITRSRTEYGAVLSDNGDLDSQALTDQLTEVPLRDITFDGTTYFLEGPYVRIHDVDAPIEGDFSQTSPDWHFTRGEDAFEAVNAYYHIDQSLRYINETLGFALMPIQYSGGVLVDPHGASGDDQSFYSGGTGSLTFGEGGVDDAEDADVLLHELGHGLHDWVTNGGLSQVDGLGEGSGDYWANSYSRSTGLWNQGEDQRSWIFHWDGHNEYWSGRTADYAGHYPEDLENQIHTDGQIWASSLMEIWEELGRETTDLLFLEALSMTGSTSSQPDAAFALMQADSLLNAGANSAVIQDVFLRRGYLLRANFASSTLAGPVPLTVTFIDGSFAVGTGVDSRAWDFDDDGVTDATGQRVQFTYEEAGLYTVSLTVTSGANETTTTRTDFISANEGVYLWQGGEGQFDRSGDFFRNHFLTRGISSAYAGSARMHTPLEGYDAVFLSLGSFSTGPTRLDEVMASGLKAYLEGGGKVYLEGSEALGFDQVDNAALLALFGISTSDDGTDAETPVQSLSGQTGTLTEGMLFGGTTQVGTTWIDRFTPQPPAVAAFVEGDFGTVAVQHELAGGGRTFVSSYALGHLLDSEGVSTRVELLDRILEFFGVATGATAVEDRELPGDFRLLPPFPNPFSRSTTLRYELPRPAETQLILYNMLGQRVATLEEAAFRSAGVYEVRVRAEALPAGPYFVRLQAGGFVGLQSLLVVR